jgi:hypothetical protein
MFFVFSGELVFRGIIFKKSLAKSAAGSSHMEPEGGGWGISEKVRRRVDFLERSCGRETQSLRCQVIGVPFGEVARKQNRGAWAGEAQSVGKKRGEVALDPECFARSSAAESWGIENDGVKRLTALGEATEVGRHILGNEAVMFEGQGIEFKISASALEKGFRNIHTDGFRANTGCGDREGAGVGEGIQNALGMEFAEISSIGALIAEKAGVVAGLEIDFELESALHDDLPGRGGRIALQQNRSVFFAG